MPRTATAGALLLGLVWAAGCPSDSCEAGREPNDAQAKSFGVPAEQFKPPGELQARQSCGEYTVRLYRDAEGNGGFEIRHDGKRVFTAYGFRFYIGTVADHERKSMKTGMGRDITGNGVPDLVLTEWTGGAHCCFIFHLFELGERPRYVQSINARHTAGADFVNLDADRALEFSMVDWTFAYWNECFADSPAPPLILKYRGGRYVVAAELMREPPPAGATLESLAAGIAAAPDWGAGGPDKPGRVPTRLWGAMLDLIYSGNMSAAEKLVDLAWGNSEVRKGEFLRSFGARLETSPYWSDIRKMNQGRRIEPSWN